MNATNTNLRQAQILARAPRALFYGLVVILCLAGLRSILDGPAEATSQAPGAHAPADWPATAYAQAFARVYLTWSADEAFDAREKRLEPFLVDDLDAAGGIRPAAGTTRDVQWTTVVGDRRVGGQQIVTVQVGTSTGTVYLAVPVQRSSNGGLAISAYPAIVGPPTVDTRARGERETDVDDDDLHAVAERALRNYLSLSRDDLLADLTEDAVVSSPVDALELERVEGLTWVTEGRRVAVEAIAKDAQGTEMTLRYELDVTKTDRWFVRSIHVDPTFGGRRNP